MEIPNGTYLVKKDMEGTVSIDNYGDKWGFGFYVAVENERNIHDYRLPDTNDLAFVAGNTTTLVGVWTEEEYDDLVTHIEEVRHIADYETAMEIARLYHQAYVWDAFKKEQVAVA